MDVRWIPPQHAAQRTDNSSLRVVRGQEIYDGGNYGPLTRGELTMLQELCGYEFSWPPKKDEAFPAAAADLAMIHLRQGGGLAGSDTFAELLKHNQMALRINGQAAFDDEFLRAAAKLYGSTSPAGQGFLAGGGHSPLYA